jgi:hypothetical protein
MNVGLERRGSARTGRSPSRHNAANIGHSKLAASLSDAMPSALVEHLSPSSVAALRSVLGKNLWLVCSAAFEVSAIDNILIAQEVVLPIEENGFLVMANDGLYDSPVAHVSYYSIGIARSVVPAGLNMSYDGRAASFGSGVSHLNVPHASSATKLRVTRIEVYEAVIHEETISGNHETVCYDKAICLYREDGAKICFRLEDSIRAAFQILFTDAQVSERLKELHLRSTWEA